MGMAALAEPLTVKISSKRQITIPAKIYKGAGFKDYALCTWTDKGMFLQPLDVEDEDVTVDILRYLIEEGYEGGYRQESCALFRQPHKPAVRCGYPSSRVTSR